MSDNCGDDVVFHLKAISIIMVITYTCSKFHGLYMAQNTVQ